MNYKITGEMLNRYVKVKGHSIWHLVLEAKQKEPEKLSETMQTKILRSEVCQMHNPVEKPDFLVRVTMAATHALDYEKLASKYGTILIRSIGSFMPLKGNEITEEVYDTHFPIEDFAEIVICENDNHAEWRWVKYLENRFPGKKIATINYFDLRSEEEVQKYFDHAKYITFSTTFTNLDWYKKLSKFATEKHTVIGHCHTPENWEKAMEINANVEVVEKSQFIEKHNFF